MFSLHSEVRCMILVTFKQGFSQRCGILEDQIQALVLANASIVGYSVVNFRLDMNEVIYSHVVVYISQESFHFNVLD